VRSWREARGARTVWSVPSEWAPRSTSAQTADVVGRRGSNPQPDESLGRLPWNPGMSDSPCKHRVFGRLRSCTNWDNHARKSRNCFILGHRSRLPWTRTTAGRVGTGPLHEPQSSTVNPSRRSCDFAEVRRLHCSVRRSCPTQSWIDRHPSKRMAVDSWLLEARPAPNTAQVRDLRRHSRCRGRSHQTHLGTSSHRTGSCRSRCVQRRLSDPGLRGQSQ